MEETIALFLVKGFSSPNVVAKVPVQLRGLPQLSYVYSTLAAPLLSMSLTISPWPLWR